MNDGTKGVYQLNHASNKSANMHRSQNSYTFKPEKEANPYSPFCSVLHPTILSFNLSSRIGPIINQWCQNMPFQCFFITRHNCHWQNLQEFICIYKLAFFIFIILMHLTYQLGFRLMGCIYKYWFSKYSYILSLKSIIVIENSQYMY